MLYKHTMSYGLSFGLPAIVTFISIAVFTRLLSPEEFGYYSLLLVVIAFINNILFQWIRLNLLRFLESYEKKGLKDNFFSTIFFSFILIVTLTGIIGIIIVSLVDSSYITYSLVALILIVAWLKAWQQLNLTLFRVKFSPLNYGIFNFLQVFFAFFVGFLLVSYFNLGGIGLVLGMGVSFIISSFYPTYKNWFHSIKFTNVSFVTFKEFLIYGIPLTVTLAMGFIINSSDRLFISWLLDNHQTGIYSAGYDFADKSLLTLMSVINLAAFPLLIKAYEKKGEAAASFQMKQNAVLLFIISIPAMIGLILLAEEISLLFFGEDFSIGVANIIPLITIGAFLKGIKLYYVDLAFQLAKKTKIQILPVLFGAIVNVILNMLLIPSYGLVGAALATVIAYAVAVVLGVWLGSKYIKYEFPWFTLLKIVISSVLMALVVLNVSFENEWIHIFVSISLGLVTYCLCMIILFFSNFKKHLKSLSSKKKL